MGRALALLRFYLRGHGAADFPVAALLLPAALSGTFALLLRADVTPFAFSVCALSLTLAMVTIPLLGELGYLLRADSSSDWVEAQPITPREVRTARALHLVCALVVLTLGSLLPAALFAPSAMGFAARAGLVLSGLGLATVLTSLLLLAQAILGGRAESLFIPAANAPRVRRHRRNRARLAERATHRPARRDRTRQCTRVVLTGLVCGAPRTVRGGERSWMRGSPLDSRPRRSCWFSSCRARR